MSDVRARWGTAGCRDDDMVVVVVLIAPLAVCHVVRGDVVHK